MRESSAHALRAVIYAAIGGWWAFLAVLTLNFYPPLVIPLFGLLGIEVWASLMEVGRFIETRGQDEDEE